MEFAYDEIVSDYSIVRKHRSKSYSMLDSHFHKHYEIYYLLKGSVRYFVGDSVYDLCAGDAILIPPNVIHKTAVLREDDAERLLICFSKEFILTAANDKLLGCFKKPYHRLPPVEEIINKAETESRICDCFSRELIKGYIREILAVLSRETPKEAGQTPSKNGSIMQNAVLYIDKNYQNDITLEHTANHFALSQSHFSRQFKAYTGFGFSEYLTLVRIKNAQIMLETTKYNITEVASKCGFNSSSYFTAVFRKINGITPFEIKRRRRVQI